MGCSNGETDDQSPTHRGILKMCRNGEFLGIRTARFTGCYENNSRNFILFLNKLNLYFIILEII
jgi:hypothetical protein